MPPRLRLVGPLGTIVNPPFAIGRAASSPRSHHVIPTLRQKKYRRKSKRLTIFLIRNPLLPP
jgi:hypothetical protein